MSERASYFDFMPELEYEQTSSPNLTHGWFPFVPDGSLGVDPSVQTWESIDLDLFDESGGCDRPPAQSATSTDSDNGVIPRSKITRRRAQNRASQRALRERKERHVKGLEHQLTTINEKHQDLIRSYTKQTDHVTKLHHRITELQAEIKAFKSYSQQRLPSRGATTEPLLPERFDAFSVTRGWDPMLYDANEVEFDLSQPITGSAKPPTTTATATATTTPVTLPEFEDLLHLP
ncbi:hypothetical protein A1O3_07455 [Capronia epimyces CBS 606.96]|uniref:BZIP domain-containing protein n=1 Tax=Capronia epimyces CBS 606.96 TaxID=1182542 RepID=W9XUY2_9EURO|nr:uncharacterized protein A1O3_07455 [Capronia epimyces CBS 606.96]EXJ81165.1 hypothetical protein A1O3_07455 [Capronia epimyces CBS 606.96]